MLGKKFINRLFRKVNLESSKNGQVGSTSNRMLLLLLKVKYFISNRSITVKISAFKLLWSQSDFEEDNFYELVLFALLFVLLLMSVTSIIVIIAAERSLL